MGRAFQPAPLQFGYAEVITNEIKYPMYNGVGICLTGM
jgi:hypothetical protein